MKDPQDDTNQPATKGDIKRLEQSTNDEIKRLDTKIDKVDTKIDKVDAKIDKVEQRLDTKIDNLDAKIDKVEQRLDTKIDKLEKKVDKNYQENRTDFARIDFRMEQFEKRMDSMEEKMEINKKSIINYMDQRFNDLESRMYTKDDHAKFMIYMDEAMQELRDTRRSRLLTEEQMVRQDDQIANHEKRIQVLEKTA